MVEIVFEWGHQYVFPEFVFLGNGSKEIKTWTGLVQYKATTYTRVASGEISCQVLV